MFFTISIEALSADKSPVFFDPTLENQVQISEIKFLTGEESSEPNTDFDRRFRPLKKESANLTRSKGYIWFRFQLISQDDTQRIIIRQPAALSRELVLFRQSKSGFVNAGAAMSDNVTSVAFYPQSGSHTYYLRLNSAIHRLDLEFWASDSLIAQRRIDNIIFGSFIFVTFISIFFSIILAVWYKETSFAAYVVSTIATVAFFGIQSGMVRYIIPTDFFLKYNTLLYGSTVCFLVSSLGYYMYHFLGITKDPNPMIRFGALAIIYSALATSIFIGTEVVELRIEVIHFLVATSLLYITIFFFRVRSLEAKIMASSWLVLVTHAVAYTLHLRGFISGGWYIIRGVYFGIILQYILYNLAVLVRFDNIRRSDQESKIRLKQTEAAKAKEQEGRLRVQSLLHVLCHDLANPLTVISCYLNMAIPKVDEPIKKQLSTALGSCSDMEAMMLVIRTQEAIRTGKHQASVDNISVSVALHKVSAIFNDRAEKKQVAIITSLSDANMVLSIDPTILVYSILANLLSNAIKFSPRGSKIHLNAYQTEENVILEVKDNGSGIPAELISVIFDESQASSRPGTSGEEGTGFGTLQVKRYTEIFGGNIQVQSQIGVDAGTTFKLKFPTPKKESGILKHSA